eukprot:352987-Chlamydomonas_euryale.AAC.16
MGRGQGLPAHDAHHATRTSTAGLCWKKRGGLTVTAALPPPGYPPERVSKPPRPPLQATACAQPHIAYIMGGEGIAMQCCSTIPLTSCLVTLHDGFSTGKLNHMND